MHIYIDTNQLCRHTEIINKEKKLLKQLRTSILNNHALLTGITTNSNLAPTLDDIDKVEQSVDYRFQWTDDTVVMFSEMVAQISESISQQREKFIRLISQIWSSASLKLLTFFCDIPSSNGCSNGGWNEQYV